MTNKKGRYSLNSKKTKDNISLEDRSSIHQSQRDYIYVRHLIKLSLSGDKTRPEKTAAEGKRAGAYALAPIFSNTLVETRLLGEKMFFA